MVLMQSVSRDDGAAERADGRVAEEEATGYSEESGRVDASAVADERKLAKAHGVGQGSRRASRSAGAVTRGTEALTAIS
jgi:hypothetical protein